jgi:hypothetical protein
VEDPTSIRTYANQFEAETARSALNAAGIEALLSSDETGGIMPSSFATGGVRLYVAAAEVDRAIQLLRADAVAGRPNEKPVEVLARRHWRRTVLPGLILGGGSVLALLLQDVPGGARIGVAAVAAIIARLVRQTGTSPPA